MNIRPLINIAIANDHVIFRRGLKETISSFNGFHVNIEADNGAELIDKLENADTLPDICMLDIALPVLNGYETLVRIKQQWPSLKAVILSMSSNEYSIISMLKSGANAYLPTDIQPEELRHALTDIFEKGHYYSQYVSRELFQKSKESIKAPQLSEREKEILALCCTDLTYKAMGYKMGIGLRTVETYRDRLFKKLNIKTRIGLAIYAMQTGIVDLDNNTDLA